MNIGILVLSAGKSSRLGKPKQELHMRDGRSMLQSAVAKAKSSKAGENVVVVSGANFINDKNSLERLRINVLKNERWHKGMGSTIKEGLKFMLEKIDPEAMIIMVIDQPNINEKILNKIIDTYLEKKCKIVACRYASTIGTPVLFGKSLFHEILKIPDDKGALGVVRKYKDLVVEVSFPGGEFDIDTMEDYREYQSQQNL